ncbi:MAG: DnaB-like helicase N-terminal domain-containing protein [Coleofasciculus sp. A1-SPW-01]|uniref:DnaB-like helicase N-terminal domain-containing protein n=1 Tax=Coleofasciculus sp. A1-SPW-01 TaxID=3070819 RepID=UPI0032F2EC57
MTASTNGLNFLAPHNLDAEEAILGGIMLDPGAMDRVADLLSPEAFYVGAHQEIYRAANKLYQEGQTTDFMAVTSWLHDHKRLDKVGGQSKIAQLIERTVSAVNIDRYAELVVDCYQRRLLMSDGWELAQLAADKFNPLDTVADIARRKLEKILHLKSSDREKSYLRYQKLIAEVEAIELKIKDPGFRQWELQCLASKYSTSVQALEGIWYRSLIQSQDAPCQTWQEIEAEKEAVVEWALHGFAPLPGLVLLHAPGGTGKTRLFNSWALSIATGIAWEDFPVTSPTRKVLFVQTDELRSEMINSLRQTGFSGNENIEFKMRWSIDNIPALVEDLPRFRDGVILIDSLTSVSTGLISENDVEYAKPLMVLRKLAQEYNCCIFLLHHSSREGNVRGTSALEAASSIVLKLSHDPDHPQPDSPHRILEFQKARMRRPTRYALEFVEEYDANGHPRLNWHWRGEYKREDIDLPLKDRIVRFLSVRRNIRYECAEISHEVGGSLGAIRRAAGRLAKDGIISSCEGQNRRMQYFLSWFEPDPPSDPGGSGSDPDHSPDHSPNPDTEGFSGMSDPGSLNGGGGKKEITPETSDPGSLERSPTDETTSPQVLQPPESSDPPGDPPGDPGLITEHMNDCIRKIEGFLDTGITEYTEPLIEAYTKELGWLPDQVKEVRSRVDAIIKNTSGKNGIDGTGEMVSADAISGAIDADELDSIFDRLEVGDRVCRTGRNGELGTTGIVTRKSFRPRQVEISFPNSVGIPKTRAATPEELEVLRLKILARLRVGMRIQLKEWTGTLSSRCKNGKWYVNWDGFPGRGIRKRYGEPPTKPIAPQDFEVIVDA